MSTILMTKGVWMNSQFSIARFSGGIYINGKLYIVIGSEEDLVDDRFAYTIISLKRMALSSILPHSKDYVLTH